jgi:membrane associated rhomboid family serine protease
MLAERRYLRHARRTTWSVTTILVGLNLGVYAAQMFAEHKGWDYLNWLALRPLALIDGHVWQLLTFQFLHDPENILHLLLNTAMLWFFGRQVEGFLGRWAFLKLYLLSGVVGGLTQLLVSWAFAGQLQPELAVLGASAGVCGLIAAFAAIHWEQRLILWLFFIIPIPMRGKNVVLVLMGLCLFGAWLGGSNIAHAAHFGGIWMGLVYIRWIVQADRVLNAWEALRSRVRPRPFIEPVEPPPAPFVSADEFPPVATASAAGAMPADEPGASEAAAGEPDVEEDDLAPAEFIALRVDPILEKISAHGIDCLTDQERRILERARDLVSPR